MAKVKEKDFCGTVKWRILELPISKKNVDEDPDKEDIYVSFTSGNEHGPIIERGDGSPRMLLQDQAITGKYTTDPELQRLGCWFISPKQREYTLSIAMLYMSLYWNKLSNVRKNGIRNWSVPSGKVSEKLMALGASNDYHKLLDLIGGINSEIDETNGVPSLKTDNPNIFADILEILNNIGLLGVQWNDLLADTRYIPPSGKRCILPSEKQFIELIRELIRNSKALTDSDLEILEIRVKKWLTILLWATDTKIHTKELWLPNEYCIHGWQGCGDLSMNYWSVALIKKKTMSNGEEKEHFIFPCDEPVEKRTYTCLVKWKKDKFDFLKQDSKANIKDYVEIRKVKFHRPANEGDPGKAELIVNNGPVLNITDKIEFAVYGQQVIRDGEIVDLGNTIPEYSDLRHVFFLPNMNPGGDPLVGRENGAGKFVSDPDQGRPREIFDRKQTDDVWFGEFALLGDEDKCKEALSGPVSFCLSELGATEMIIERALYNGGANNGRYYRRQIDPIAPLREGEWRKIEKGDKISYEIWFKKNTYPCSIIGTTNDGWLLSLACVGPYSSEDGWTINRTAEHLKSRGVTNALLIDEGGDVYQYLKGANQQLEPGRDQVRAAFLFTHKKRESEIS